MLAGKSEIMNIFDFEILVHTNDAINNKYNPSKILLSRVNIKFNHNLKS